MLVFGGASIGFPVENSSVGEVQSNWLRLAERCTVSGPRFFWFQVVQHWILWHHQNLSNAVFCKVVLELCDNPEKLIGYWLFASSGWSFWSSQRNLFKETSFLFWVWLMYLYKSNLARKCKIRSGWNWPTFTHYIASCSVSLQNHCRIARSFCTGLRPKVSRSKDAIRVFAHLTYYCTYFILVVDESSVGTSSVMRAVSIACIRIELLVDDLPFGDGWPQRPSPVRIHIRCCGATRYEGPLGSSGMKTSSTGSNWAFRVPL